MYLSEIKETKEQHEELRQAAERLRWHSLEITSKAGSGHPTSSLSCAEIVSVLFFQEMQADSSQPENLRNDRFVLSKGHAAPVLWSVYYEAGLIDKDELRSLPCSGDPEALLERHGISHLKIENAAAALAA